jgi:hypothetical protein
MKSLIRFSSHLLPMANPKLNPPWSRYRHGCDPPHSRIGCECLPPFSTPHQFFVGYHSLFITFLRLSLTELGLFKNFYPDWMDIRKLSKETNHDSSHPVQTTKLRQHLRGGRIYRVEDILINGDSKEGDSAWVTRKEAPMKQSLQHGHFAAWSVLVLVLGLALLCPDLAVATDRPVYGGLGGNYFRAECPKGSYLVGVKGSFRLRKQ